MNKESKLSNADYRLLSIVWDAEPIASPELCKLAEAQLGWKRTTTYTVLKRLCDKRLLQNENTIVSSLVGRQEVQKAESREVINRSFDGSLPQFIASFLGNERISDEEAEQIKQMIDVYRRRS
ncbi:MAG: BlaI/MecI/CopY family transcriptional regulator [Clostridiaceae bacterium]|jgi:predicted transcriptional regulator|nr:BlaI/MecI/CopY family transcriptional regulator [Clostridiaceae bacterium]